jgi:hypothetical protein
MASRDVRLPPSREPEHNAAASAIGFASEYDREHHQTNEHLVLKGRVISVDWSDDLVAMTFESGASLLVRIVAQRVEYTIQAVGHRRREARLDDDPVTLRFSPSLSGVWDRAALAEAVEGETLKKIFVTPDRLLLYVSQPLRTQIVAFSVLIDANTGTSFVYWDFSE